MEHHPSTFGGEKRRIERHRRINDYINNTTQNEPCPIPWPILKNEDECLLLFFIMLDHFYASGPSTYYRRPRGKALYTHGECFVMFFYLRYAGQKAARQQFTRQRQLCRVVLSGAQQSFYRVFSTGAR
jgi:hypothetical protein